MKLFPRVISLALASVCILVSAYGESPYERDLKQLVEQRDKAVAAATAPIMDKFKANAEQLLKRATQAGDLDAANKIKASIDTTPVNSPAAVVKDLRKQLAGTTWKAEAGKPLRGGLAQSLSFTEKTVEPGGYRYEIDSHNSVTITFTGGDKQVIQLTPDGKRLKFTHGKTDHAYDLAQ